MACTPWQPTGLSGEVCVHNLWPRSGLTSRSTAPLCKIMLEKLIMLFKHAWKLLRLHRTNEINIACVVNPEHSKLSEGRNFQKSHGHNNFYCMGDRLAGARRRKEGRHMEEGMFPARKYWSSMGHAKCYSSQKVGSKVHRTRYQQSLPVPNYRPATSHSCAWLNKKYYQTQGKKASSQHWMGKMSLEWQGRVFSGDAEWDQSVYMMIGWWVPKQKNRDHHKGQAMDQHHERPVKWGKGHEESWGNGPKEPNTIRPLLLLLSRSWKKLHFSYLCVAFGVWLITSWWSYHMNKFQPDFLWRSYSLFSHFILEVW